MYERPPSRRLYNAYWEAKNENFCGAWFWSEIWAMEWVVLSRLENGLEVLNVPN